MNGMIILYRNLFFAYLVAIGLGGAGVFLTNRSRLWGLTLDAVFLSAGVLLLVQAAFLRRDQRQKMDRVRMINPAYAAVPLEDDIQPTRFGIALVLAAVAGLLALIPASSQGTTPPPPEQIQALIQLFGKTESDLNECAKSKDGEKVCKWGDDAEAAQVGEILHRLDEIVKLLPPSSKNPPPEDGSSPWGTVPIVVLVLAIAGAIIWLTLKLSPSKTPLAITAALVAGMIKGAKLLPQPGGDFYWYSIFVLLGVGGIVVLLAAFRWKGVGPAPVAATPTTGIAPGASWMGATEPPKSLISRCIDFLFKKSAEHPESDSPMVIGFSILLLACTMAYLGEAHGEFSTPVKPCPACPAVANLRPTKDDWKAVTGFGERDRAARTSDLDEFRRDLETRKFTETDLLLLLGSTDCIPVRKNGKSGVDSNQNLAARRAEFVQGEASRMGLTSLPTIVTSAVLQAESCSKAVEQRAVYPLLFRAEAVKSEAVK